MSARHALLGLLLDRPGYPYELGERLQRRLGPAWRVNSGQLYQDIEWLRNKGHIERITDRPTREGRHVYAITSGGVEAFEEWLDEVTERPRPARRPLLAKVTLAGPARLRRTLEQIDAYQRDRAALLAELVGEDAAIARRESSARADQILLRLNLSADIYALQGELRWARRARDVVLSLLEQEEVVWPSMTVARARAGSADDATSGRTVRKELFARMSARPIQSVETPSAERETDRQQGTPGQPGREPSEES
jgi:DNA-binding PadR family transcriptional regulator